MKKAWILGLTVLFLSAPVWAEEEKDAAPQPEAAATATDEAATADGASTEAAANAGEVLPPEPPKGEWKANAAVNAVLSTGNSSSQNVAGKAMTSYKYEKNKVEWTADGAYGRAKDPTTGDSNTNTKNWKTQLRYDRFILEPLSLFGLGHLGQDKPAGFDWRYGGAVGVAHELWKVDPNYFKYEFGFDYTRENRTAPPDENVYSARIFLQYKRKISEWASFGQDVETLFNLQEGKDVRINSLTALTAKMTDKVSLQAGFAVKFDNQPVPGKKKTDTQTQVGLLVEFM